MEEGESPEHSQVQAPSKKRKRPAALRKSWHEDTDPNLRKIEPQQNWLARLFRVKPATRFMCLAISKRRARQEVAILLRGWRKYGIEDIEVDQERNIVFARVGSQNCEFCLVRKRSVRCVVKLTNMPKAWPLEKCPSPVRL